MGNWAAGFYPPSPHLRYIAAMRIIAGEFRGRRLLPPQGDATRPITDRAKQSLFDILAPLIPGSAVYDCFAGTGSLGLECLSRGAAHATFFESDPSAITLLRQNIALLKVENRAQVVAEDIFIWFAEWSNRHGRQGTTNLVFFDPPYRYVTEKPDALCRLAKLIKLHHLAGDGLLIFRHDAADTLELPPLVRCDLREYGGMALEFLRNR